jgi:hypothetical protein
MKTKLIYIISIMSLLLVTGCEDLLDKSPLDYPSSASFYNNQAEVDMGLLGCYNKLTNKIRLGGNRPWIIKLDNSVSDISWNRDASAIQPLGNGTASSDNGASTNAWIDFYAVIGRTNFLLDNIHNADEAVSSEYLNQVISEARFLRAYCYFYLTEMFGDVPLVTKTLSLGEAQMARTPKSEVVDWILAEMDEIVPSLPLNHTSNTGRATNVSAYFLKAYTALCNSKWTVASQAAKAAMDLGYYELEPNYANVFTYAGQNSKEIVWAMQYLKGTQVHDNGRFLTSRLAAGVSNEVPTQAMVDSYECIDGLTIDESPLFDPLNPYANRDPRLAMSIALPHSIYLGFQFETHPDSLKVWNYNINPPVRVNNTDATNAYATFTGYLWRKWTNIEDITDTQNCDMNIPLMRYAELYLMYAEAKIEANDIDESVYDALDAVRQRAGMPIVPRGLSQAELRSVVRRERKIELAMEGRRMIDLRRWRIAEKALNGPRYGNSKIAFLSIPPVLDENSIPDYSAIPNKNILRVVETVVFRPEKDYLWPINPVELETNLLMVQNPNW